jgi:hypothetical protein
MWNRCHVSCSQNPLLVSISRWEFQACWVNSPVGTTFRRKSSPLSAFPGAPVKQLAVAGHLTATTNGSCTREKLKKCVLLHVTYGIRVSCKAVAWQSVVSKSTYLLPSETRQSFISFVNICYMSRSCWPSSRI